MPKIVLYHPWIYLKGGAEKVLLEYKQRSKHQVDITCGYLGDDTFPKLLPHCKAINNGLFEVNVKRTLLNSLYSLISIITSKVPCNKDDILVISSEGLGDFLSLLRYPQAKCTIAYVHTPLKLVYDKDSLQSTKLRLGKAKFAFFYWFIRPVYKFVNRFIWRRYNFVIANSSETKQRILDGKLIAEDKIKIVYPGASPPNQECLMTSEDKFVSHVYLIPGRIMIQKNIEMGIEAFIQANISQAKLIITGHCDEKSKAYLEHLQAKYTDENIIFHPNPCDTEFQEFHRSAKCVVFPPVNEDWGITPVEAMAQGTPVVCSNRGGPSESVLHQQTGLLCDPSVDEFAKGIVKIASLNEQEYVQISLDARKRANQFTWENFNRQLDKIVDDVISSD